MAKSTAADDTDDGEQSAEQPKKKLLSLKTIIVAAAALVLLLGGAGAGVYFFMFKPGETKAAAAPVAKPVVFVDLPELLVNLSTAGGDRPQYLKVKVVLELSDQAMINQIQPIMPRVMDAFQTYLRELRPSDLDGSAGLYRLKEELTRRVNVSIAPSRITAVLFKEIVVQ
jgi:flagellar protein FliL